MIYCTRHAMQYLTPPAVPALQYVAAVRHQAPAQEKLGKAGTAEFAHSASFKCSSSSSPAQCPLEAWHDLLRST
jgi:hypothetical protein